MWHLPASEMERALLKGGFGKEGDQLSWAIVDRCYICKQWEKQLSKPTAALGTLAIHFNGRLQTEFFTRWSCQYIILVDECIRVDSVQSFAL
jgi:hypothetical protein